MSSLPDELSKLAALHKAGALTDDEFDRKKRQLLNGAGPRTPSAMSGGRMSFEAMVGTAFVVSVIVASLLFYGINQVYVETPLKQHIVRSVLDFILWCIPYVDVFNLTFYNVISYFTDSGGVFAPNLNVPALLASVLLCFILWFLPRVGPLKAPLRLGLAATVVVIAFNVIGFLKSGSDIVIWDTAINLAELAVMFVGIAYATRKLAVR